MNELIFNNEVEKEPAHVLFVDDQEFLAKLWKQVIERWGFRVTSFTKGLLALEEFRANPEYYDIVITDQSMPEITGFELAEEMLKIRSDIKIIICSGYFGDINNETNIKVNEVLLKPFDSNTLLEAINRNLLNL